MRLDHMMEEEEYEVQTVRPETQTVKTRDDKSGQNFKKQGIGFRKVKTYFVCKSTDHLIKDCNFHDKKSQEPKLKNVVNTGQREGKPVWDNTKRVNHQNFSKYPHLSKTFVPSGVLTRTGLHRPSVSTARPVCTARPSVSTARQGPVAYCVLLLGSMLSVSNASPVCTAKPNVSIARPVYATRPIYPRMDNVRPKGSCSPIKRTRAVVNTGKGKLDTDFKKSRWVWRPKGKLLGSCVQRQWIIHAQEGCSYPEILLLDHASGGIVVALAYGLDNQAYLPDYDRFQWCFVAFGSDPKGGKINGFKLLDESQVVLRAPRKDDVYNLDLKNIVPSGGHLVRGLPLKVFVNDHTFVSCKKGKQHKASCKAKLERIIRKPLELLHMDLFGPVSVESINKKRCDNGTEFKNYVMNEFYAKKGIKREFSVARTPQQIGVAERKNRTLIEAARTMFWQFLSVFGHLSSILEKSDEGYLLGYFTTSKAFRLYNKMTKRVEENLHINFLEDQPNVTGTGPNWMFDLDFLTNSMNYIPVSVENHVNVDAATSFDLEKMIAQEVVATALDDATRQAFEEEKRNITSQKRAAQTTSITKLSTGRSSVSTATTPYVSATSTSTCANAGESSFVYLRGKIPIDASTLPNADLPIDLNMPDLEDDSDAFSSDGIFNGAYDDENVGAVADFNNMDDTINVSPIPTLRIHKNHPKDQILRDPKSAVQTRGKIQKASSAQQALVSYISKQNRTNHKDHQNCLLACFLSQEEPNNISQALQDESWVEAMQEELLQFKLQKVWILVDFPSGKKAIGTKWVFKNKRDERSIVMKNKAKLVAQGFRQEEGINYDKVFAHVARIEAIRLFLAFASYMGFTVYQMDVKSAFLYGTIE
ncbi:putative ribonuclease H-like domain-containing protein [Tanacetum coccineum]